MDQTFPKPPCHLTGTDGNIFALAGTAGNALKKAGLRGQATLMYAAIMQAGSYEEALAVICTYVEVS